MYSAVIIDFSYLRLFLTTAHIRSTEFSPWLVGSIAAFIHPVRSIQPLCIPDGTRTRPIEIARARVKLSHVIDRNETKDLSKGVLDFDKSASKRNILIKSLSMNSRHKENVCHLMQEAALLSGLNHSNVIKLIGIITLSEPVSLLLEYCEYAALISVFGCVELSLRQEYRMAAEISFGMAYLVEQHIVHRDLTSANVRVSDRLQCKIGLSGLSRYLFTGSTISVSGDPIAIHWASPEALAHRLFSEQSDVWSFGVVVYELWSKGRLPFGNILSTQLRDAIIRGTRPPLPSDCTPQHAVIFAACWSEYGARATFAALASLLEKAWHSAVGDDVETEDDQVRVDEV